MYTWSAEVKTESNWTYWISKLRG